MSKSEKIAMSRQERYFMKKDRRNLYIALEDIDFIWDEKEVERFINMWNEDIPLHRIAKDFNRPEIECAVLIMDLDLKGEIKQREHGLQGYEMILGNEEKNENEDEILVVQKYKKPKKIDISQLSKDEISAAIDIIKNEIKSDNDKINISNKINKYNKAG